MNSLKFFTYHQSDFLAQGQLPDEDALAIKNNSFCVADGIRRDPLGIKDFLKASKKDWLAAYPNPSPATKAAQSFCEVFIKTLNSSKEKDEQMVREAMILGNEEISQLNKGKKTDYLVNDLAGCVAAGGIIQGDNLFWTSIGDCQIVIFDLKGKQKLITPLGTEKWSQYEKKHPGDWQKSEYRQKVRSQFRNNPKQVFGRECVSYGALTGEKTAHQFIESGREKLAKGDLIIAFTDGFFNLVKLPDFFPKFLKGIKKFRVWEKQFFTSAPSKFGKERTLVAIKI